jgi:hypothetical protein
MPILRRDPWEALSSRAHRKTRCHHRRLHDRASARHLAADRGRARDLHRLLGDGTFFTRNRPSNVIGITDAVGVFVGLGFACAVHEDGGVSCWGSTDHGQIGTYATIDVEKPQAAI